MAHEKSVQRELFLKAGIDRIKWRFIGGILLALILFAYFYLQDNTNSKAALITQHLLASSVQYIGHSKKGEPYRLSGSKVESIDGGKKHYLILDPALEFLQNEKSWIHLVAKEADYFESSKVLEMKDKVQFYHNEGAFFETEKASLRIRDGDARGELPIRGESKSMTLTAEKGFLLKDQKTLFFGSPILNILDQKPLRITANDFLEYDGKQMHYHASGSAQLFSENLTLKTEDLYADLDDGNNVTMGRAKISKLHGVGNVEMNAAHLQVFGERFAYHLNKDRLDVWERVHLIQKSSEQHVFSDHMIAFFKDQEGGRHIEKVQFIGHVKVKLKNGDVIRANHARYHPAVEKVFLYDDVFLQRGRNLLRGREAVLDLKTGMSHLVQGKNEQVQGAFRLLKTKNKKVELLE